MALLSSALGSEVGLRLLLSPSSSNIVVRTACTLVGVGFPVYTTFKAIEKKDSAEQEEWLVYWTVYGCFSIAETFSDKLLSWVPFYYHTKFIILVWLQIPNSFGARHLFMMYLRPFFLKHQNKLDHILDGTRKEMNKLILSHQGEIQFVKNSLKKLLTANVMGACNTSDQIVASPDNPDNVSGKDSNTQSDNHNVPHNAKILRSPDHESEWIDVVRDDD